MSAKKTFSGPVLMIFSNSYDGAYPRELSRGFRERDVGLAFISLSGESVPDWVKQNNALDYSTQFYPKMPLFKKILKTFLVTRALKPSIIQTHLFFGGIVGLTVGKLLKIPVIHTRHHIDEHYQAGTFIHRWIDRQVAKRSTHIVVCSQAAKDWLVGVEGVRPFKISVINQGFDFDYLSPGSTEIMRSYGDLGFTEKSINVVCAARYSKAKGQNYLLEAIKNLKGTVPNILVTFMGPGDSSWLRKLSKELRLESSVRILPSRKDVPACLAAADIVIHPSLADSFSQLVIEAQAVGAVLVASDIAAVREQVIDGVTGIIIPPRDSRAIENAVIILVGNPELAQKLRREGPLHVRQRFTWQRMIKEEMDCLSKYHKVYTELSNSD